MLFNTQLFLLIFLPLCAAGYYVVARSESARSWWLIAASMLFYSYWDVRLTPLLIVSIAANWALVRLAGSRRNWLLGLGVVVNLTVLGVFKYVDFFAGTLFSVLSLDIPQFSIVLPLGISFFTFQQISYLVDRQRGKGPTYLFREYALYVSFFPQLIAGPIVRHDQIIAQYQCSPVRDGLHQRLVTGMALLTLGLIKKLMFADEAAEIANPVFTAAAGPDLLTTADAWLGLVAFTVQIYFDFSAYSDMAIGLALLFGFSLPVNFNAPYTACSISDFWRRWHITLSEFLRDYLYIPLGGNRFGAVRLYMALMLTMLLGGLWHGAAWTFVAWGGVHGAALVVAHTWRANMLRCPKVCGWVMTLAVVMLAWVFFRAPDFAVAGAYLAALFGGGFSAANTMTSLSGLDSSIVLWVAVALALVGPTSQKLALELLPSTRTCGIGIGVALAIVILAAGGARSEEFIYFQF